MTTKLLLSQNKVALIDKEQFDFLTQWHWMYVCFIPATGKTPQEYVCRGEKPKGVYKRIYLHVVLREKFFGKKEGYLHFKNGNRLDFRRDNLELTKSRRVRLARDLRKVGKE